MGQWHHLVTCYLHLRTKQNSLTLVLIPSFNIIYRIKVAQRIEVPGTSRCIPIYSDDDDDNVNIVVQHPSDCLVLQSGHINLPEEHELYVHLPAQDSTTTASSPTEGWHQVFTHLLETFQPPLVSVNVLRTECDIQDRTFHKVLDDGTLYYCGWASNGRQFLLKRYVQI